MKQGNAFKMYRTLIGPRKQITGTIALVRYGRVNNNSMTLAMILRNDSEFIACNNQINSANDSPGRRQTHSYIAKTHMNMANFYFHVNLTKYAKYLYLFLLYLAFGVFDISDSNALFSYHTSTSSYRHGYVKCNDIYVTPPIFTPI